MPRLIEMNKFVSKRREREATYFISTSQGEQITPKNLLFKMF